MIDENEAVFDITCFGGQHDNQGDASPAINAAIAEAARAGGGRVYVPAGTYRCFSIHLLSNVELHFAAGAVIIAADSPRPGQSTGQYGGRYDLAEAQDPAYGASQDHGHNHWHNSLIWAENAHDIAITGAGTLVGTGLSNGFAGGPGAQFDSEQPGVANKAIALKNCRGVCLRDVTIIQGGWFAVLLTGVDNAVVDGVCIDTNRDGIDVDCCRNVHISNCTINSPWDDAICLKSSYALGKLVPTENVTVIACVVSGYYRMGSVADGTFRRYEGGPAPENYLGGPSSDGNPRYCGRIKLGTESVGGFRNITITGCVFEGCDGLAVESVDGGDCEDIVVCNLTMRDIVSGPLFLILGDRLRGPAGMTVGHMRRISISNIVASGADPDHPTLITGTRDPSGNVYRITDVTIAQMTVEHLGGRAAVASPELAQFGSATVGNYPDPAVFGALSAQGVVLRHVRGIDLRDISFHARERDERPVIATHDAVDVRVRDMTVTPGAGQPRHELTADEWGQLANS